MKGNASRYALHVFAVASIVFLSGCAPLDWVKDKFGGEKSPATPKVNSGAETIAGKVAPIQLKGRGDKVLVTLEGVPVMTIKSFEEEYEKLLEENPQLKQMAQFIPDIKENIFKSLRSQMLMDVYIEREGIDKDSQYQEDLARFMKSLKRMLNSKYFSKRLTVSVSDSEVKKFYDENKEKVPGLIVSQGGVRAVGIKFESKDAAKAFYDKAKGKSKNFDEIAKADKLSVEDLKLVNDQSLGMNAELRKKITALKNFPLVDMIKVSDKEYWVVNATAKEERQYRSYDEVKDALRSDLEREKEMKEVEKAIEKLEKDYKVEIDQDALKMILPPPPAPQKAAFNSETPEEDVSAPIEPKLARAA